VYKTARKKNELNVLWYSTGFPSGFHFFFVSSVCLPMRVTMVDKNKAVICIDHNVIRKEEKKA